MKELEFQLIWRKRLRHIPSGRARAIVRSRVKRVEIMLGTVVVVDINRKATTDYSGEKIKHRCVGLERVRIRAIVKALRLYVCVANPF